MIVGVVGDPGSGKSLYAATVVRRNLLDRSRPWLKVYTNLQLVDSDLWEGQFHRVHQLAEPLGKRVKGVLYADRLWELPAGSLWVLDEVDSYFDALDCQREVLGTMREYVRQHRKLGHNGVWITQNMVNVYVRIRRRTERVVVCYNTKKDWLWRYAPTPFQFFIRQFYKSSHVSAANLLQTERVPHPVALRVAVAYSTTALHGRTKELIEEFQYGTNSK